MVFMIIKGQKKGMVLIMVFMIMIALVLIVGAYLYMVSTQTKSAGYDISNAKAFWAAESGVQMVAYKLKTDAAYRTSLIPNPLTGSLGGGTYSANVVKNGSNYNVASMGTCNNINRKVTCVINVNSVFSYAGFGNSSISMSGGAMVDSYDSSLGRYNVNGNIGSNGNIGGNGDITVTSGSPYIHGNASTGPSGTFSDPNHKYISGTVSHASSVTTLTPVTVPSTLTGLASGGDITLGKNDTDRVLNSGNYKFSTINLSSIRTLTINATTSPVNIYITGNTTSISITNSGQINIPATNTYPVIFYTDGSVNVSGAGVLNNTYIPSNIQLYGNSSSAITVSNSGAFYGAIYAPSASLTINGNADAYGSFVSNSITLGGSGKIHYDQALAGLSSPFSSGTSTYSLKTWNEVIPAQ